MPTLLSPAAAEAFAHDWEALHECLAEVQGIPCDPPAQDAEDEISF